jgi:cytochrome b561
MTTSDPFERAVDRGASRRHRRQQAKRLGFKIHLAVYVAVQVLLFTTWLLTTAEGFPWFVFPLVGWGIGLAAHAVATYGGAHRSTDEHEW